LDRQAFIRLAGASLLVASLAAEGQPSITIAELVVDYDK